MTSLVVISCPACAPLCSLSFSASELGGTLALAFVVDFACGLTLARARVFVVRFALASGFGLLPVWAIVFAGGLCAVVFVAATSTVDDLTAGDGATSKRPCSAGLAVSNFNW